MIKIGVKMSKYPQAEKVAEVQDKAQDLGDFMEWLNGKYYFCEFDDESERLYNARPDIQKTLAEYLGIDWDAYQKELDQMLKELQENQ
jgi:hypothetical protein